jgi:hypothetical protein
VKKGNSFPKEVVVMKKHKVAESIAQEQGSPESHERRSIVDRGHGEKLGRLMDSAIIALLESGTIKEAAGRIGIAESTLRSWYRDPVFRQHYNAARQHILEAGTTEIADLKLEGIAVLRDELNDWDNPRIRHDAAKFVVTLADRELQRLDAERRFNASREKRADKQRGDMTIFEVLEHCGMTVEDSLNLASAVREGDPEVPGQDTPPAAEAARSAQIIADHRRKEGEPCHGEEQKTDRSAQIGADHRQRDDDSKEAVRHVGYRDSRERLTSAQVIAHNGKSEDSHVQDDGRPPTTTEGPPGDGGARDHGTSAQTDADGRETDGTHPVGGPATRHHTGNEDKPRPPMIRRHPAPMTAADDLREAQERERKPSRNDTPSLSAEREEGEEDVESAFREARLLREQVQRERYPEAR